jgi:hypothetical protein
MYVARLGVRLTDAQPKRELLVQLCVGQIQMATPIETIEKPLIDSIPTYVSETHQIQGWRNRQFKPLSLINPPGERLRQLNVASDVVA